MTLQLAKSQVYEALSVSDVLRSLVRKAFSETARLLFEHARDRPKHPCTLSLHPRSFKIQRKSFQIGRDGSFEVKAGALLASQTRVFLKNSFVEGRSEQARRYRVEAPLGKGVFARAQRRATIDATFTRVSLSLSLSLSRESRAQQSRPPESRPRARAASVERTAFWNRKGTAVCAFRTSLELGTAYPLKVSHSPLKRTNGTRRRPSCAPSTRPLQGRRQFFLGISSSGYSDGGDSKSESRSRT